MNQYPIFLQVYYYMMAWKKYKIYCFFCFLPIYIAQKPPTLFHETFSPFYYCFIGFRVSIRDELDILLDYFISFSYVIGSSKSFVMFLNVLTGKNKT